MGEKDGPELGFVKMLAGLMNFKYDLRLNKYPKKPIEAILEVYRSVIVCNLLRGFENCKFN